MDAKIRVEGLAQLNRSLRKVDTEAPKQLRLALNEAATGVADRIRATMPEVTGAARRSLVARSTRTSARVAMGGNRAPYTPWLDFGGQGRISGRPAARPFIAEGRYFYPGVRREAAAIAQDLQDALSAVIRGAGLQED